MELGSLASAPFSLRPIGPAVVAGGTMWFCPDQGLSVITSIDGGFRHLSVAHPIRYPTWAEIMRLRHWYFPAEMEVVMVLARRSEYVNVHPNCFHLWESACGREGR
jgi:hypothetical protein